MEVPKVPLKAQRSLKWMADCPYNIANPEKYMHCASRHAIISVTGEASTLGNGRMLLLKCFGILSGLQ
jgi:hypothetical protein